MTWINDAGRAEIAGNRREMCNPFCNMERRYCGSGLRRARLTLACGLLSYPLNQTRNMPGGRTLNKAMQTGAINPIILHADGSGVSVADALVVLKNGKS